MTGTTGKEEGGSSGSRREEGKARPVGFEFDLPGYPDNLGKRRKIGEAASQLRRCYWQSKGGRTSLFAKLFIAEFTRNDAGIRIRGFGKTRNRSATSSQI